MRRSASIIAALLFAVPALAQTYPAPIFSGLTLKGGARYADPSFPTFATTQARGAMRADILAPNGQGTNAFQALSVNGTVAGSTLANFLATATPDVVAFSGWALRGGTGSNPLIPSNIGAWFENNSNIVWAQEIDVNNEGATQAQGDDKGGVGVAINTGSTYSPGDAISIRRFNGAGTGPGFLRGVNIQGVRDIALNIEAMDTTTFPALTPAAPGAIVAMRVKKSSDSWPRFQMDESGGLNWGGGSANFDAAFYRAGVGIINSSASINLDAGKSYQINGKPVLPLTLTEYAVDPTGATDSSAGVQAAVTAALAKANGATIRVPAGTYKISAQVSVPKTTNKLVTFECDAGAKFVADAALVQAMFYVGSNSVSAGGANFASLGCTYTGANTTSSRAFKLENANVSIFRNNAFRSMFLPVDMISSYGVEFDGNMFETNTSYSIHSSTSAHHLFLHGNKFYNTGTAGTYTVLLDAATDNLVVRDNDIETGWTFLGMAGGSALTFEGNYLEYFSNTPLFFSSSVVGASIRQNWISLSGNLALGNIAGGEFKFNSSFNQTVTQGATATSLVAKGNVSTGTGATLADTIDQSFQATTLSNLPTTGTQYFGIGQSAFEVLVNTPVAKGGTLRGLYVTLGAAPGGTASYAFTLRVNGADTGVTCTVTGAATTCNDTTHTAAITAGQTWDIKAIATGTPAAQTALAAVGFVN